MVVATEEAMEEATVVETAEGMAAERAAATVAGNAAGRVVASNLSRRSKARVRAQCVPSDGRSIVLPIKHSMVERPPRPPPSYKDVGG